MPKGRAGRRTKVRAKGRAMKRAKAHLKKAVKHIKLASKS